MYNRYLQNRSLSQINQLVSQTTTKRLTEHSSDRNHWNSANTLEDFVHGAERYYSAESLQSILVCTGVYNRETYDEISSRNHAPRDVITDPELKIPQYTCEHVLDAVKLILHIEQFE